jgi:ABC-type multidrug transport system ATPase subunit
MELNDGLVAIIGPKGSGKTALADMIADVAGASIEDESAFLLKAKEHLVNDSAQLAWISTDRNSPKMRAPCRREVTSSSAEAGRSTRGP